MFHQDPYYRSAPAEFILTETGIFTQCEVVVDPHLTDRVVQCDRRGNLILVRPGLSIPRMQAALGRAAMYIIGGGGWAPEFHAEQLAYRDNVIPLQRRKGG